MQGWLKHLAVSVSHDLIQEHVNLLKNVIIITPVTQSPIYSVKCRQSAKKPTVVYRKNCKNVELDKSLPVIISQMFLSAVHNFIVES